MRKGASWRTLIIDGQMRQKFSQATALLWVAGGACLVGELEGVSRALGRCSVEWTGRVSEGRDVFAGHDSRTVLSSDAEARALPLGEQGPVIHLHANPCHAGPAAQALPHPLCPWSSLHGGDSPMVPFAGGSFLPCSLTGVSGASTGGSGATPGVSEVSPGVSGVSPGESGASPGVSGACPWGSGAFMCAPAQKGTPSPPPLTARVPLMQRSVSYRCSWHFQKGGISPSDEVW